MKNRERAIFQYDSGPLPRPTTRQDDTGSGGWAGGRAGNGFLKRTPRKRAGPETAQPELLWERAAFSPAWRAGRRPACRRSRTCRRRYPHPRSGCRSDLPFR
ncbi:hypothetical protein A6768_05200 [Sphingobium yanoikuyae]|uniref:Uncharacterized protein n=1 Tax=Sphingobium yanoikuyae TaxID=13690 RepID=A0A291MX34_SPHYA|nr:hypothetical protein A6768_05200 [Sphingobium yanoikuyae]